ncbi:secreted glycine rich protein, putative, partial [Ixodes scapularis]
VVIDCLFFCIFMCIARSNTKKRGYNMHPRQGSVGSRHDPSFRRPRNIFGGYGGRHYGGSSHNTVGRGGRYSDRGGGFGSGARACDSGARGFDSGRGVGSGGRACHSGARGFDSGGGVGSGGRACDSGAGGSDRGGSVCESGGGGGGGD